MIKSKNGTSGNQFNEVKLGTLSTGPLEVQDAGFRCCNIYLILFKYYFDYNNLRKHPLHLKHSQFLRSQITATNALIVGGQT